MAVPFSNRRALAKRGQVTLGCVSDRGVRRRARQEFERSVAAMPVLGCAVMAYYCWSCQNEQIFDVKVGIKVGRRDSCPHCAADLHVCKNCKHWDPSIHNQCREPEAAFIGDREASN